MGLIDGWWVYRIYVCTFGRLFDGKPINQSIHFLTHPTPIIPTAPAAGRPSRWPTPGAATTAGPAPSLRSSVRVSVSLVVSF